jgi:hypothetical protein
VKPLAWARAACQDPNLSSSAVTVALVLAVHATNSTNPTSKQSVPQLMTRSHMTRNTLRAALRQLRTAGRVEVVFDKTAGGGCAANIYCLIVPPGQPLTRSPRSTTDPGTGSTTARSPGQPVTGRPGQPLTPIKKKGSSKGADCKLHLHQRNANGVCNGCIADSKAAS